MEKLTFISEQQQKLSKFLCRIKTENSVSESMEIEGYQCSCSDDESHKENVQNTETTEEVCDSSSRERTPEQPEPTTSKRIQRGSAKKTFKRTQSSRLDSSDSEEDKTLNEIRNNQSHKKRSHSKVTSEDSDSDIRKPKRRAKNIISDDSDEENENTKDVRAKYSKKASRIINLESENEVEADSESNEEEPKEDSSTSEEVNTDSFVVSDSDSVKGKSTAQLMKKYATNDEDTELSQENSNDINEQQLEVDPVALTDAKLEEIKLSLISRPKPDELHDQPEGLKKILLDHQLHGLKFMIWRENEAVSGGIIADEMGIGKSAEVIALIVQQKENQIDDEEGGATLIITDLSLIEQWHNEFKKFCKPNVLKCYSFYAKDQKPIDKIARKYDVVITNYSVISSAFMKKKSFLEVDWERIVLDEAHGIRNPETQKASACLSLTAKYRWVVSGSPVQVR